MWYVAVKLDGGSTFVPTEDWNEWMNFMNVSDETHVVHGPFNRAQILEIFGEIL